MNSSVSSILTVREVAEYLRVNERTVYRLASDGRIPAFKVGKTWRFRRADIDSWIAAQASIDVRANETSDLEGQRGNE